MRHDTSSYRRLKPSCAAPRLGVEATLTDIRPEVPLCNALVVMLWSVCSKLLLVQRFEWPLALPGSGESTYKGKAGFGRKKSNGSNFRGVLSFFGCNFAIV